MYILLDFLPYLGVCTVLFFGFVYKINLYYFVSFQLPLMMEQFNVLEISL